MYGKREKLKRRAVRRRESRGGTNKILKQCLYGDNCQVSSFLLTSGRTRTPGLRALARAREGIANSATSVASNPHAGVLGAERRNLPSRRIAALHLGNLP